jgi:hypothetical protein
MFSTWDSSLGPLRSWGCVIWYIRMHKFIIFANLIVGGFMISICDRHNILATRISIMKTRIPYTIDHIYFTLNRTIDYRNSLTKCWMGRSFKVVKLKSLIVQAHKTSRLITQHWNLSIWLNKILLVPNKLTTIFLFSFFDIICISNPPSTSIYSTTPLCFFLSCYVKISTSFLLTLPFIFLNIIFLVYPSNFYTLGAT